MADFYTKIAAIAGDLAVSKGAPILPAPKLDIAAPLPLPERSFVAVMQNRVIEAKESAATSNRPSPFQMIAKQASQGHQQRPMPVEHTSSPSQARVQEKTPSLSIRPQASRTKEIASSATSYRHRALVATATQTVQKAEQAHKLVAQLENLRQRVGQMPEGQGQKVLLAINSATVQPQPQAQLQQGIKQIYGDLSSTAAVEGKEDKTNLFHTVLTTLASAQDQLGGVFHEINALGAPEASFQPGQMLRMQMRFAFVQQQLDFFANAAGKALQSISALLNVQS